jgi:FkbM family methyltransferase
MTPASKLIPINVFPLVVGDLLQRLESKGGKASDFFFVQIGAHDGLHYDPIRPFVKKYHWGGLLVEPQPEMFDRLIVNYADEPQLVFENAAIAHQNGVATLYTFKKTSELPDHVTMLASFYKNALVHNGHNYKGEIEELRVPALTLKTLLLKHKVNKIDLLQIDTEGYDFEIIKLLEDCPIKPELIHFESAFLDAPRKHECGELLHRLGYRALTIGIDTIAYRQSDDNFEEAFANKGYDLA